MFWAKGVHLIWCMLTLKLSNSGAVSNSNLPSSRPSIKSNLFSSATMWLCHICGKPFTKGPFTQHTYLPAILAYSIGVKSHLTGDIFHTVAGTRLDRESVLDHVGHVMQRRSSAISKLPASDAQPNESIASMSSPVGPLLPRKTAKLHQAMLTNKLSLTLPP